jgi:hypothetical protein
LLSREIPASRIGERVDVRGQITCDGLGGIGSELGDILQPPDPELFVGPSQDPAVSPVALVTAAAAPAASPASLIPWLAVTAAVVALSAVGTIAVVSRRRHRRDATRR